MTYIPEMTQVLAVLERIAAALEHSNEMQMQHSHDAEAMTEVMRKQAAEMTKSREARELRARISGQEGQA